MKVLVDECAPRALARFLSERGHPCLSVQEAGWSGKRNGELLRLAETRFEVLVTLDTNLQYQQNLRDRRIAVVVIVARSNRLVDLRPLFEACARAIEHVKIGEVELVG